MVSSPDFTVSEPDPLESWPLRVSTVPGKPAWEVSAGAVARMLKASGSHGWAMSSTAPPTTATQAAAATKTARSLTGCSRR